MVSLVVNFLLFLFQEQHTRTKVNGFSVQLFYKRNALALSQLSVGLTKWRIYRVFKVFSEHLEMKKVKSLLGQSSVINAKHCLYLYCFLMQRIYLVTRPNDFCLSAQA